MEVLTEKSSESRNVAPNMRPVAVTLTAGEWEALFLRSNGSRTAAEIGDAKYARISIKSQLAKAGVF